MSLRELTSLTRVKIPEFVGSFNSAIYSWLTYPQPCFNVFLLNIHTDFKSPQDPVYTLHCFSDILFLILVGGSEAWITNQIGLSALGQICIFKREYEKKALINFL